MYNFENKLKQFLFESPNINEILNAINNKEIIKINYAGDSSLSGGERLIECYLLGKTTSNNLAIRAYQIQGSTKTEIPGWKIFLVGKILSWEKTNDNFSIRGDYNQYGDKSFSTINHQL